MHRRCIALLALTLMLGHQALPIAAAKTQFPDMDKRWYRYREAVGFLVDRGVISGYDDGTFRPTQTINRAEFLKILFKGKSDTQPISRRCFSDVDPRSWYGPFVCAAKQRGIVQGYKGNEFRPEDPVNTAEALKMTLNAYGIAVEEGEGEAWYVPYVDELDRKQILAKHSYIPWEPLTRERAADLLWRVLLFTEEREVPALSPGCGKSPPDTLPASVAVDGVQRPFILDLPRGYTFHDPVPLIVAFHGRTNSNAQVRDYFHLDRAATDHVVVYPAALKNGSSFSWLNADGGVDTALFDAIVQTVAQNYCIDMDRIATVGHSLGAWMANSIACLRGGAVMASATVGGDSVNAACTGPAAAMIIHNPKDNLAPFAGAERVRTLRVEENACRWESSPVEPQAVFHCTEHLSCASGNTVVFCPHTEDTDWRGSYYPHTWPSGTAEAMIRFLKKIP